MIFGIFGLALTACSTAPDRTPVPKALAENASIPGYADIRFWGDRAPDPRVVDAVVSQTIARIRQARARGKRLRLTVLAVSGGGSDGAFGAGLLVGWSDAGTRPQFDMVTGISTGSLIAPFVFLGLAHDQQLKTVYTTIETKDVAEKTILQGLTGGSAVSDSKPLFRLISKYVNAAMMEAIAREQAKGRRLYIGTTNIDAQRPVTWDIGAIAASGRPESLNLIRRILLASASIPAAFPPVMIDVEADGKTYREMHVDGGVAGQVFLYPGQLSLAEINKRFGRGIPKTSYIIRNGKIGPEWQKTEATLGSMAGRAISTLIKYQANGDLIKLYGITRRDGITYRLAYIPSSFDVPANEMFDRKHMNALYKVGYDLARTGYPWAKSPPGLITTTKRK